MVEIPEGWIAHDGGPCPVRRGTRTRNLHRDGSIGVSTNYYGYGWQHRPDFMPEKDIIGYKLTGAARPERKTP